MTHEPLILASASPRRQDLLRQLGVTFQVDPANIDESLLAHELPRDYVQRMASEKAEAVMQRQQTQCSSVLAADTCVVLGERILGKPSDAQDAGNTLRALSDDWHTVMTAICLATSGEINTVLVETRVQFCTLSDATISRYLATDEPWDKAGAYAIQGLAGAFVSRIEGSYSNVVGLPLQQTREMLVAAGIATALDEPCAARTES